MHPNSARVEILLCMIVYLGVVGFGAYIINSISPTKEVVGRVSVVVLGVTGLVLIWYTVETRRLRVESQRQVAEAKRQTEVQQRPFVVIEKKEGDTSRSMFYLKNIGRGSAFNVKVGAIGVDHREKDKKKLLKAILHPTLILISTPTSFLAKILKTFLLVMPNGVSMKMVNM